MMEIANVLGIVFEQRFVITEKDIIQITNKENVYNIGDYLWKK